VLRDKLNIGRIGWTSVDWIGLDQPVRSDQFRVHVNEKIFLVEEFLGVSVGGSL
jgi:hypothetical protein